MGVLDGVRKGSFGVNLGRPIVNNGDGDALFPNYFGEDLLYLVRHQRLVRLREIYTRKSVTSATGLQCMSQSAKQI